MMWQAMMARRALLLIDGIDEGGELREAIERHITEVLAPQGHVMLVTSRPNGLREERFKKHFYRVTLSGLTLEQQEEVGGFPMTLPQLRPCGKMARGAHLKHLQCGHPVFRGPELLELRVTTAHEGEERIGGVNEHGRREARRLTSLDLLIHTHRQPP